jgi:hypothetical protein
VLLSCGLLLVGCGASSSKRATTYGGFPSYLPPQTLTAGSHRVVDASATAPALATQGDTVRVHLAQGTVQVTVVGPEVPVEGSLLSQTSTPATWTVTLSSATAALPVDPATFQAVDETGRVVGLHLVGPAPAQVVRPGTTVRFQLHDPAFPTGEGRLRWIPSGHLAPVEWDFVAETD